MTPPSPVTARPALAVVLITRNQEANVDRLVTSVLAETAAVPGTEIVLVDSASTDDTVARAATHPIRVLRLDASNELTAAAGRHIGFQATNSDHVLFLDGDMELVPGWLANALRLLGEQPSLGVLGGIVVDVPPEADEALTPLQGSGSVVDIRHAGGAAIYRRAVLEHVGGFNPYLSSDEEPELCLRIRRAGYRVARLDRTIALHHSAPEREFRSLFRRRRRRLYLGSGQALRYLAGRPEFVPYLRERGYALAPAALVVLVGAGAAVAAARRDPRPLEAAAVLLGGLVLVGSVRKRSLRVACQSLLHRLFILEGTVRGALATPRDPALYPGTYEVIK